MSIYNPPSLQHLAVQSLLLNEASTISTLEYLPPHLFPPVFKEAFTGRHMQLLKAMVAAWPFSYLPVGALMETPNVELLQAVLGGVDILQAQKVRPSGPSRGKTVQLCCVKMIIFAFPVEIINEVLDIFLPDDIEELELFTSQVLIFLGHIAPHFGHMTKLRKFCLTHTFLQTDMVVNTLADIEEMCALQFLSEFSKHNSLNHLSMEGIYFSHLPLQQLLSCLKSPLESLSINLCYLTHSDLINLSQCQRLCQLKHLNLSNVVFSKSGVTHLRVLLENTADSLQTLELANCRMGDSELSALLPALSQCSQITTANFYDNDISTAILKKLVQSMANLSNLTAEFYPAPLECYDPLGSVHVEEFSQLCIELRNIVFAKRQPKTIVFGTGICLECRRRCVYNTEIRLCQCWQ
ncbi:melanoma antigen preferentially expressed in tumors-like [Cricetulus griseus]|uniref:Melanoma antigen preferentially expressed in tumors-like n=1 Tax=Cricetulus griseus TaxID=10029 RepID=A0A9J7KG62_CRIGR|nr:melanoma antigen preferentially expressed in tumors-like [Cricetulus griseus]